MPTLRADVSRGSRLTASRDRPRCGRSPRQPVDDPEQLGAQALRALGMRRNDPADVTFPPDEPFRCSSAFFIRAIVGQAVAFFLAALFLAATGFLAGVFAAAFFAPLSTAACSDSAELGALSFAFFSTRFGTAPALLYFTR